MSKLLVVSFAELSLAIAGLQDELAEVWDSTLGKWAGPSPLPGWADARRAAATEVLMSWPESLGGWIPDDEWEGR